MGELTRHWTERNAEDYLYRIASDFVRQISKILESNEASRAALAKHLDVSPGRISQVLNNPGNLTLKQIIKYARALGRKVSIVTYDDNDPGNLNGPISAEVFVGCWENAGRPADFFALREGGWWFGTLRVVKSIPTVVILHADQRADIGPVEKTAGTNEIDTSHGPVN